MNKTAIIISAVTAFIITGGGVIVGVTGSGYTLNTTSWIVAGIFGLMAAAKDVRSLLKLPPVDNGTPPSSPTGNKIPLLLLCGALALGTSGCATVSPTTKARVETAAKAAAYLGSSEYLRSHPETRPAFELARNQLAALETAETVDLVTLLSIVRQLPVKELKTERATMIVTAATILLSDYAGSLPVEKLNELKPLAGSIRQGLDLALQE